MPLVFLRRILSEYQLMKKDNLVFFQRDAKVPIFCLLPFWISRKQSRELSIFQKTRSSLIFLQPLNRLLPPPKRLLLNLQPLYFLEPLKDKSFLFQDRRFLKTTSGLYLLPPVSIELSIYSKNNFLHSVDEELFFPSRKNTPFCFHGDTTHRLLQKAYLERLQKRKILDPAPSAPICKFIKKILDA